MKSASRNNQKLENIHNTALALYNCGKYRQAADIRVKSLDLKGISNSQKFTVCCRAIGEYIQGGNENKARKLCNILNTMYKNDNKAPSSITDRAKELHRKSKYQEAADARLKILDLKGLSGNQKAQLCTYAIYDYALAKNYVKAYELYDRLSTIKGLEPITRADLISGKAYSLKMEKKYKEALAFMDSEKIAGFSQPAIYAT